MAYLDDVGVKRLSVSKKAEGIRYAESFEAGHRSEHDATLNIAKYVDQKETADSIHRLQMDSQAKYLCLARGDVDVYWRWGRKNYKEKIWVAFYMHSIQESSRLMEVDRIMRLVP